MAITRTLGSTALNRFAVSMAVLAAFTVSSIAAAPVAFGGTPTPDNTYYVNATSDYSTTAGTYASDCADPTNTDCGVDDAINAYNADATGINVDSIVFSASTGLFTVTNPTAINNASGATLTITGNGEASTDVSGGGINQVFNVNSGIVSVSNLTVQNGFSGLKGGGISNSGTLTVTNSAISGNSATFGGGIDNAGSLSVINSTIEGNSVSNLGGGIYNNGTLTVTTSTIATNTAGYAGGLGNQGTAAVTSSTISGNSATFDGGGIYNYKQGTLVAANSTVSGNAASKGGDVQNLTGTVAIAATVIATAGSSGSDCAGAITDVGYNIDSDGTCGFSAAGSISNSPTLDTSLGALADNGGPTTTIELALGSPAMRAIPTGTSVILNGAPVQICSTIDQRGYASSGNCSIGSTQSPGMTYFVNAATDNPGSYATDCTSASNTDCGVDDAIAAYNADASSGDADALVFSNSDATFDVTNPTAIDNTAGSGNTLSIVGNGTTSTAVSGKNLTQVFDVVAGNVSISELTVENGSGGNGGGIVNTGTLAVTDVSFVGNTATIDGGAIDNADGSVGTLTVTDCTFVENSATGYDGGAIDNSDDNGVGSLTVVGSTFSGNSTVNDGGAIDNGDFGGIGGPGTLSVTDSTFTGNVANHGGNAIDNADFGGAGSVTITGSAFTGNTGAAAGAINSDDELTVTSSTFSNNGTTLTPDGAISSEGTLNVSASTFSNNVGIDGGAIVNTGTGTALNDSFIGNTASHGGAIDNADSGTGTFTVTASTFAGNAGNDGGAIDNADSGVGTLTVLDSTFSSNTASGSGGAIDNADNGAEGTLTLISSTLVGNSASDGGAVATENNGGTGTATLVATIVAASGGANDCFGPVTDAGYNIDDDGTCGFTATGSISKSSALDGSLGDLADNGGPTQTIVPTPGSPAAGVIPLSTTVTISAASYQLCSTTDQRGVASSGTCTVGAVQVEASIPVVNPTGQIALYGATTPGIDNTYGAALRVPVGDPAPTGTATVSDGLSSCTISVWTYFGAALGGDLYFNTCVIDDTAIAGTNVTATYDQSDYTVAPSNVTTLTGPVSQSISPPSAPSGVWNAGALSVAATASSSLPVAYGIDSPDSTATGCSVDDTGAVTAQGAGICAVTLDQAGLANVFDPAPTVLVDATFTGAPQSITATSSGGVWNAGGYRVGAIGYLGTGALSYAVISGPCSVDPTSGVVHVTAVGSCVVTVSIAADEHYASATSSPVTLEFTAAPVSPWSVRAPGSTMPAHGSYALVAAGGSGPYVFTTTSPGCHIAGTSLSYTGAVAPATCSVRVRNTSGAGSLSAPVIFHFAAVAQRALRVTSRQVTASHGLALTLYAGGGSGVGARHFYVQTGPSNVAGCSIRSGQVLALRKGSCYVLATKASSGLFAPATSQPVEFTFQRLPLA